MAEPSVEELKKAIKGILKGADLDNLSAKKVRKMLEEKFSADFSERKKEIDKLVMKMIDEDEEDEERKDSKEKKSDKKDSKDKKNDKDKKSDVKDSKEEEEKDDENGMNGGSDAESEEEEVPRKKAKKSSKHKRKSASKADDSEDPVMSSIKNMDDEDLAKKLQEEESGLRRRRAAAPKPKKERERDPEKKKKPSLYSRPCHLSDQLAAVVGTNEMPRPDVVKTMWSIVKERNLQDPKNKQFMLCDAQMESLFGVKRVKLFSMMKHLKKHITDLPR